RTAWRHREDPRSGLVVAGRAASQGRQGAAIKRVLVTGAGGSPATNFVRSLRAAPEPVYLAGTAADPYCFLRAETHSRHSSPDWRPQLSGRAQRSDRAEGVGLVHAQND